MKLNGKKEPSMCKLPCTGHNSNNTNDDNDIKNNDINNNNNINNKEEEKERGGRKRRRRDTIHLGDLLVPFPPCPSSLTATPSTPFLQARSQPSPPFLARSAPSSSSSSSPPFLTQGLPPVLLQVLIPLQSHTNPDQIPRRLA